MARERLSLNGSSLVGGWPRQHYLPRHMPHNPYGRMDPDLQAILSSREFEDAGTCRLRSVSFDGDSLLMSLEIVTGSAETATERWEITAEQVRKHRFERVYDDRLLESVDHVLLIGYREQIATLYFAKLECDPDTLFGALARRLSEFSKGWLDVEDFVNRSAVRSSFGSGCLANGPVPLLELFKEEVEARGGTGRIVGARDPVDGRGPKVLIFGESYVIAQELIYRKTGSASEPATIGTKRS